MRSNVMDRAIVTWADGSHDTSRVCNMCHSTTCSQPVHAEKYKIQITGVLDLVEERQEQSELQDMGLIDEVASEVEMYIAKEDLSEDDINAIE